MPFNSSRGYATSLVYEEPHATNIQSDVSSLPKAETAFFGRTVDELKWYTAVLLRLALTRKAELAQVLAKALTDSGELRRLWEKLSPLQQSVVAEVIHNLDERYEVDVVTARCPGATAPASLRSHDGGYYIFGGRERKA